MIEERVSNKDEKKERKKQRQAGEKKAKAKAVFSSPLPSIPSFLPSFFLILWKPTPWPLLPMQTDCSTTAGSSGSRRPRSSPGVLNVSPVTGHVCRSFLGVDGYGYGWM